MTKPNLLRVEVGIDKPGNFPLGLLRAVRVRGFDDGHRSGIVMPTAVRRGILQVEEDLPHFAVEFQRPGFHGVGTGTVEHVVLSRGTLAVSSGVLGFPAGAFEAGVDVDIKNNGQVRPSSEDGERCEIDDPLDVISGSSLIGTGGTDEAIAQYHLVLGEGGLDDLADELGPAGHEEQGFAAHIHFGQIVIEQHVPDAVTDFRAAGILASHHAQALRFQVSGQQVALCGLAATIGTIEDNELSGERFHGA